MELAIAVASVAVAALSFVVACLARRDSSRAADAAGESARHARRSADAAEDVAQVDRDRRHEELSPELAVAYEPELVRQGEVREPGVVIDVYGPKRYSNVTATLVPPPPAMPEAVQSIRSVATGEEGGESEEVGAGPVDLGGSLTLVVRPSLEEDGLPRGGTGRLRLRFEDETGAAWTKHVEIEVPNSPRVWVL